MPTGVNLLDWRAAQRQRMRRQSVGVVVSALVTGVALILLAAHALEDRAEAHVHRQTQLEATIARHAEAMEAQRQLRQSMEATRTRLATIAALTEGRERPLETLTAAMTALPPGLTVRRIALTADALLITGETGAPGQLAAFLSALEATTAFASARMTGLQATADGARPHSQFDIEAIPAWP